MVLGGAMPVGSGRGERLDPLALPVRFTANDAGADERLRQVELDRERVVLRRAVRGIRMAINVPVTAFLGVALRRVAGTGEASDLVTLSLEHRDRALSVPLYTAPDGNDAIAEWRLWGRVLGLPLLIANGDGTLREPFRRLGPIDLGTVAPRRRRRSAIKARRPSIPLRRRPARLPAQPLVHRGEREIIARD